MPPSLADLLARLETTADRLDALLDDAHARERELEDCDCIFCIPTFDLSLATLDPSRRSPDDGGRADAQSRPSAHGIKT